VSNSQGSAKGGPLSNAPRGSIWIRDLPYIVVLILTILSIAYTSYNCGLLGRARAAHRINLCECGMAICRRPRRATSPDLDAGAPLAGVSGRDESAVSAKRTTDAHRRRNRPCHSQLVSARHLHGESAGPFLASLCARADHGPRRTGNRVDREIRINRGFGCGDGDRACGRYLVALARAPRSTGCELGGVALRAGN
jgi:hypothetical protein